MFWYFSILIALAVLSLFETDRRDGIKPAGLISALMLGLFGGLRFETGFDWPEYERFFSYAPTFGNLGSNQYSVSEVSLEPGFTLLNVVIKSIGGDYNVLTLVACLFNMAAIYFLAKRYTGRISLIFLWYFGFTFLAGQMAAVRQCLGFSFIFLAILAQENKKTKLAITLALASATFHAFAVIFVPLIFLKVRPPSFRVVFGLAAVGLFLSLVGVDLFSVVAGLVTPLAPLSTAARLETYGAFRAELSIATMVLAITHLGVLYLLQSFDKTFYERVYRPRSEQEDQSNRAGFQRMAVLYRFTVYATILNILGHSYLAALPVFWNRIMLVTFVVQGIVLTRLYAPVFHRTLNKFAISSLAFVGSLASLSYFLLGASSLPYIPYQSTVQVWLTGHYGNGRERHEYEATHLIEDMNAKRKN